MLSESELATYLEDNGYAEYLVREGSAGLVRRYTEFVEEVARGYRRHLEDYRNDLDIRSLISMAGLDEKVREQDRRLAEHLTNPEVRVWESGVTTDPFWDYGYPANAGPVLLADLKQENLA